jgi:hypothetical protein
VWVDDRSGSCLWGIENVCLVRRGLGGSMWWKNSCFAEEEICSEREREREHLVFLEAVCVHRSF